MLYKNKSQIFGEIAASAAQRLEIFKDFSRLRNSFDIGRYLNGDIFVAVGQEPFRIEVVSHINQNILQAFGMRRDRNLEIERLSKTLLFGNSIFKIEIVGNIVRFFEVRLTEIIR